MEQNVAPTCPLSRWHCRGTIAGTAFPKSKRLAGLAWITDQRQTRDFSYRELLREIECGHQFRTLFALAERVISQDELTVERRPFRAPPRRGLFDETG